MQQTLSSKLTQIAIATACAALLAACGGGGGGDDSQNNSNNQEQPGNGGGNNNGGGGNNNGGGGNNNGGSETGSGSNPSFDSGATANVAVDNTVKNSYGGAVTAANYLLHKADQSVTEVMGQRYGNSTSWKLDLGADLVQLTSNDGGNNISWSGALVKARSRVFGDEQVLMACSGTWSKFTNVAITEDAKVANIADLAGSYDGYDCSQDDFNGTKGDIIVGSDGSLKSKSGITADVNALFSANGWQVDKSLNIKARGYIINGMKVIIMKDVEDGEKYISVNISGKY